MGSLILQGGKGRSRNWLLQYYRNGTRITESSKTPDKRKARQLLRQREGAIANGEKIDQASVGRHAYTFEQAAQALSDEYEAQGMQRSKRRLEMVVRLHLRPFFKDRRLDDIDTDLLRVYRRERLKVAKPGTVKLEMLLLHRMFTLLMEGGTLQRCPHFPLPKVKNARKGFFERPQFEALLARLPAYFQRPLRVADRTGWRLAAEVLALEWRHVDRTRCILKLDPNETKNEEGRTFPYAMFPELVAIFDEQWAAHERLARAGKVLPLVFVRPDGASLRNAKTGDLDHPERYLWEKARTATGVGRVPHDCRRTAVRDFCRDDIPEKVAMQLTGHRSRTVFDRYHITDETLLTEALEKYSARQRQRRAG